MTKNEVIKLLKAHVGKRIEYGNQFYGVLLKDSYATDYVPEIGRYMTFSKEETQIIQHIAKGEEVRKLWNAGKYDEFDEDIDLDTIQWGLEIFDVFGRTLLDHEYYSFSEDSEDVFESYKECGYSEVTPCEDLDEDRLEELISDFGIETGDLITA